MKNTFEIIKQSWAFLFEQPRLLLAWFLGTFMGFFIFFMVGSIPIMPPARGSDSGITFFFLTVFFLIIFIIFIWTLIIRLLISFNLKLLRDEPEDFNGEGLGFFKSVVATYFLIFEVYSLRLLLDGYSIKNAREKSHIFFKKSWKQLFSIALVSDFFVFLSILSFFFFNYNTLLVLLAFVLFTVGCALYVNSKNILYIQLLKNNQH